ncbi:MAG: Rne/Rng family ribonuclease [Clostridia bacterium]|nr:Rne/Rng family ribonuclease [Clostridia bacterium]
MKNKIYIDIKNNNRVAITEQGELAEFYVEKNSGQKLVGNIYKGKVVNVLPGMQAAFVNIGLEKNAYLYVGESMVDAEEITNSLPSVEFGFKVGDTIMVQIVKEQFGSKGVRITTDVTLPGRYTVYMPNSNYVGVSKKIEDEETRRRLTEAVEDLTASGRGGFVIRTAAATVSNDILRQEAIRLMNLYEDILGVYRATTQEVALIHQEDDLLMRVMRDMYNSDTEEIYISTTQSAEQILGRVSRFLSGNTDVIKFYNGMRDMFEEFMLNEDISNLLKRKVPLKNGAYLIIDRTEALTVIDVNTGRYVGENNLEETVFYTNMLAAETIAKQLRLRNIGGIIIVDFIDMDIEEHRTQVVEHLRQMLKLDRIKTTVVGITGLGLVELTRKKTRSMIDSVLLQPCPYCQGDSYVYSADYMTNIVKEGLRKYFSVYPQADAITLTVHPTVFGKLFSYREISPDEYDIWTSRRVYVVPDPSMHVEKYEIKDCGSGIVDIPDTAKLLY